jgi:hypothetical protein
LSQADRSVGLAGGGEEASERGPAAPLSFAGCAATVKEVAQRAQISGKDWRNIGSWLPVYRKEDRHCNQGEIFEKAPDM